MNITCYYMASSLWWRLALFSLFFSLFFLDFLPNLATLHNSPLVFWSLGFDPYSFNFLLFYLFQLIYIIFFFNFILNYVFNFIFDLYYFDFNLFYQGWFLKLNFFTISSSFIIFTYHILSSFFLLLFFFFFCFDKFFKLIFFFNFII